MGGFTYTFPLTFEDQKLIVDCDWNNDGNFGQDGEYLSGRVDNDVAITLVRGRDQIRQLAPPMVGSADFDLWNQSKDYSPENAASPLYGNLVPGRTVRIRKASGSAYYPLFQGFLDDIPQHPELDNHTVSMPCLGALSKLRGQAAGQPISTALYSAINTGSALGIILDTIGWPTGARILNAGQTTLDWWWLDNEDAFSAAVTLLNSEGPGAALYEDASGNIVFEDRWYRTKTARSNTSQATFNGQGTTTPLLSLPFNYNPNLQGVINVATVTAKTRAIAGALTAVWSLGQTVTLAPNENRQFQVKGSDIFTQAALLVGGVDYTLTAGSLVNQSIDRTSGASCTIALTAGSSGATLTGLQLRAKLISVTNTTYIKNTVDTSASQTKYGQRNYPLTMRAEIAVNSMQDLVNGIVANYQAPRPTAEVTLYAIGSASDAASNTYQVYNREISDRVTIVENQTVINADFYIERIAQKLEYGGKLHSACFGCEKASGLVYFVLGTSALDGNTVVGF